MEYKSTKNRVKAVLGFQVNLAQMKLEDGITIIEAEEFAPDFSVGIVTADGVVPMPIGEYTLEDGMVLVVAVEGIIAEVKEATTAEEEAAPEVEVEVEAQVAPQAPAPQAKRVVESVSKETFFAEIEKLRTELSLQINEVKAENESLKSEKEALEADKEWPHHAPHVAMQLVDAAHLEAERTARQAAQLRIEDLQAHLVRADAERCKAVAAERERLCALIKAADDKASEGDYMLDSDDCISVIRGTWGTP